MGANMGGDGSRHVLSPVVVVGSASVAAKSRFRWEPGLPKKPVLDGAAE